MKRLLLIAVMALPVSAKYYSYDDLKDIKTAGVIGRAEAFFIESNEKCAFISSVLNKLDAPPFLNPHLRNQLHFYFGNLQELLRQLSQDNDQLDLFLIFLNANLHNVLINMGDRTWQLEKEKYVLQNTTSLIQKIKELKVALVQLQNIIRMHA